MANKIKPKRSYTANSVPLTTDLEVNELAIRWDASSPAIFTKNASGQIVTVALGGSGGSSSSEDTALRAYFLPTAPTNVTATAGNGQASVTWTASTTIAQIPVTDYVVQYSSNSGSTWTTFSDGTSTSTSATVTGLQNSTSYVFRVAGVNGVGTGAYSTASSAVTPGQPTDPFFSSVSLLLHMDGSDGSTTFLDSSPSPKTVTAHGAAQVVTAVSRFGGASASFANAGRLEIASASAGPDGTEDFTVEFWIRFASAPNYPVPFTAPTRTTGALQFALNASNIYAGRLDAGWLVENAPHTMTTNNTQWHHLAMVQDATSFRLYQDGILLGSGARSSFVGTAGVAIGGAGWASPQSFDGWIDELRITRGVARYTGSTITVPTAPFPNA